MPFLAEPAAVQRLSKGSEPDAEAGVPGLGAAAEGTLAPGTQSAADRSGVLNTQPEAVPIKVLIVDDQRIVAEALATLLRGYAGIDVIGWVKTAVDATRVVAAGGVDP